MEIAGSTAIRTTASRRGLVTATSAPRTLLEPTAAAVMYYFVNGVSRHKHPTAAPHGPLVSVAFLVLPDGVVCLERDFAHDSVAERDCRASARHAGPDT